jgi:hypothetical protein
MPLGSPAVVPEAGRRAGDRRWLRGGDGVLAFRARWAAAQVARGRRRTQGARAAGPDLGPLGPIGGPRAWRLQAWRPWHSAAMQVASSLLSAVPSRGSPSASSSSEPGGDRRSSPKPRCACPALAGPSRSLLGALGTPAVVVDVLLPSTSCLLRFSMHASAHLRSAGVRSSARVKTLLGVADADHGDTCGCHFLLGGVFLGQTVPPLCARGNPRSALSDRPAAAFRRRPLLEGAVLAKRVLCLSELVASPVFCEAGLCCVKM